MSENVAYTLFQLSHDDNHREIMTLLNPDELSEIASMMYRATMHDKAIPGFAVVAPDGQWYRCREEFDSDDLLLFIRNEGEDVPWDVENQRWIKKGEPYQLMTPIRARMAIKSGLIPESEGHWYNPAGKSLRNLLHLGPKRRSRPETEQMNIRVRKGTGQQMKIWATSKGIVPADVIEQGFELMQERYDA